MLGWHACSGEKYRGAFAQEASARIAVMIAPRSWDGRNRLSFAIALVHLDIMTSVEAVEGG
jgi:hypothetical protein